MKRDCTYIRCFTRCLQIIGNNNDNTHIVFLLTHEDKFRTLAIILYILGASYTLYKFDSFHFPLLVFEFLNIKDFYTYPI